ncbi:MAG TPA: hypothetical protein VJ985_02510 [Gammaproteobacteria bacterium]|nr:hypothetical protein [Gammaproteobacteria bacterium]
MALSGKELDRARAVAESLLEALGIEAYLFEVEPEAGADWVVRVECAVTEGWQTHRLTVPGERLLAGLDDADVREALGNEWREVLAECRRKG